MTARLAVPRPARMLRRRLDTLRYHLRTPGDAVLALRMLAWRVLLPALKRVIPLQRLAKLMAGRSSGRRGREEKIVELAGWLCAPRRSRRDENCLERGLLLYRF